MVQTNTQMYIQTRPRCLRFILFLIVFFLCNSIIAGNKTVEERPVDRWSFGLNLSTYGPGVEISRTLTSISLVKLSYNYFSYKYPLNKLDDELDGNAILTDGGASLVIDYYVWHKLYLSAGIVFNQLKANIDGQMSESVYIGDIEMYPDELGTVHLDIVPDYKLAPYVGIGVGHIIPTYFRFSASFEVGVIYLGEPQVNLKTTGMLEPTSSKEQEAQIQENISPLDILPTLTFRVAFKLGGR